MVSTLGLVLKASVFATLKKPIDSLSIRRF